MKTELKQSEKEKQQDLITDGVYIGINLIAECYFPEYKMQITLGFLFLCVIFFMDRIKNVIIPALLTVSMGLFSSKWELLIPQGMAALLILLFGFLFVQKK